MSSKWPKGCSYFKAIVLTLGLYFLGITSFNQITKDRKVAQTLKSLYRSVNNLDLWVGGLAEDHLPGSDLGPTFQKIFVNQMTRLRDGDRFWYTRILSQSVRISHVQFSLVFLIICQFLY